MVFQRGDVFGGDPPPPPRHRVEQVLGAVGDVGARAVPRRGMLAGSEGLGRIAFDDYGFGNSVVSAALAFILFDGGLRTCP